MGNTMSLPACQQRVLDHIENALQHREPRLASMFAMFTRLNKNEGAPRTETLEPQRWWTVAWSRARRPPALLIPLALLLVMTAVVIGMSSSRISCPPASGLHGATVTQSHASDCPAASKYAGFGHGP
jgi:hypothetical protein